MKQWVHNYDALALSDLRVDALAITTAGLEAIDIATALTRELTLADNILSVGAHPDHTRVIPLTGRRVYFVGVGKCAFGAADAIEKLFGEKLAGGIALDVTPANTSGRVERLTGTHPLPSETNVAATKKILTFLALRDASDLVLMLISGGGSTLLCAPEGAMTANDESALFHDLTTKGASIQEINTVRKHTSRARGGGLAAVASPATVLALIVSDVPGNDISFISSGPTVCDTTSISDAKAVLTHYGITAPATTHFIETPKDPALFAHIHTTLFLTSGAALTAMEKVASTRGYHTEVVETAYAGEAQTLAHAIVERLHTALPNTVHLYAGEATVSIGNARGKGGRNQELALAALAHLRDNELILPIASDGYDNTDHAGAIADTTTRSHALEKGVSSDEALASHASYDFFTTTGDALITGAIESNVSDIIIAIKK